MVGIHNPIIVPLAVAAADIKMINTIINSWETYQGVEIASASDTVIKDELLELFGQLDIEAKMHEWAADQWKYGQSYEPFIVRVDNSP